VGAILNVARLGHDIIVPLPHELIEREQPSNFRELFPRVTRIYLDELGEAASDSLGINVVKLVIEREKTAPEQAKRLIEQAQVQITDETTKQNLIDLIETIIVYKLPQKSREEIQAMFGLSELKQTKVYQEAQEEGEQKAKLKAIPRLMQLGLSVEMIAEGLDLPGEVVQPATQLFAEQNVVAFIELLQDQRSLFSPQDLADLTELIEPLPNKIEDLSQAIAQWCKQDGHSLQRQTWRELVSGKVAAIVEELLATNLASLKTFEPSVNKVILQQAIE